MICLETGSEPKVWDLDSTLPFPCPFEQYAEQSLRVDFHWWVLPRLPSRRWHPPQQCPRRRYRYPELRKRYRVVRADQYLAHFSSDRSHMRNADGRREQCPVLFLLPCAGRSGP